MAIANAPEESADYCIQFAIIHARLGHKALARQGLAKLQQVPDFAGMRLYAAAVVAAELGEGYDQVLAEMESAVRRNARDPYLEYNAACAYSQVSRIINRTDKSGSRTFADRAIVLVQRAIEDGYADYPVLVNDPDLEAVREYPAFKRIAGTAHPDRHYAVSWTHDPTRETIAPFGLDPASHRGRCRQLAEQGYRPTGISAARVSPSGPLVTASVWSRPIVSDRAKDLLAGRQARAAVALLRLKRADAVWPLLRHNAEPRLRSMIVNLLAPMKVKAGDVVAEFARLEDSARPHAIEDAKTMDAILFEPGTSMRRALILALGTYGTDGLSPTEREGLSSRLLASYESDPDAGVHGAIAWTLRQWNQRPRLDSIDRSLGERTDRGRRRWYVNRQGQTFAAIEGPVGFLMGSPASDLERMEQMERPRRMTIPRSYAIATTEVTTAQFRRFARSRVGAGRPRAALDRFGPEDDSAITGIDWYTAAEYCNWLRRRKDCPKTSGAIRPRRTGLTPKGCGCPWMCSTARVIVCPPSPNGSTPAGPAPSPAGISAAPSSWSAGMRGTRTTAATAPIPAGHCCRMTWACSTRWGTYSSGVTAGAGHDGLRSGEWPPTRSFMTWN